jgi:hypothetical protein
MTTVIADSGYVRFAGDWHGDADHAIQKNLAAHLPIFRKWVKYPRTYHLPWSPGVGKDDRVMEDVSQFLNWDVVVTEKMDGENTTMYRDHIHARSVNSGGHPSRSWVKNLHAQIRHEIPEGFRICGENLFAKHSIKYTDLPSCFMVFSIWDRDTCLSWDETIEWCELLGLQHVPVLYKGRFPGASNLQEMLPEVPGREGYVLRIAGEFPLRQFGDWTGKFVRKDHVQTLEHWIHNRVERNELRDEYTSKW